MTKILELAPTVLAVLGGLITLLAAIAPLTKSDLDNKAVDALRKVVDLVSRFIGAGPRVGK